jgi:hypothetical protein
VHHSGDVPLRASRRAASFTRSDEGQDR